MKKRALFLCTHNSCRSQMAEDLVNHYLGDQIEAYSAGTETTRVNPLAIKVLAELGIDISLNHSKTLDQFANQQFDYVITLCGAANEQCPLFFGGVRRCISVSTTPPGLPVLPKKYCPSSVGFVMKSARN